MKTLRELRIERVLSQEDLAKISGVAPSTLSRIENGLQKPNFVTLRKLAKALGVSPEEIQWRIE